MYYESNLKKKKNCENDRTYTVYYNHVESLDQAWFDITFVRTHNNSILTVSSDQLLYAHLSRIPLISVQAN